MRTLRLSRSGMTLIELLVGLAITGMILAAGYGAFAAAVDHRHRAAGAAEDVVRAAAIRATLVSWLAGARLTADEGGPEFRGIDGVQGSHDDDDLSFLTTAPTSLGPAHTLVRLYIDRDNDTPERGLTAEMVEWRGTRAERVELIPQATALDIRYLSSVPGDRYWAPSWISRTVLPAGVEVSIRADAEEEIPPLLRLPVLAVLAGAR